MTGGPEAYGSSYCGICGVHIFAFFEENNEAVGVAQGEVTQSEADGRHCCGLVIRTVRDKGSLQVVLGRREGHLRLLCYP